MFRQSKGTTGGATKISQPGTGVVIDGSYVGVALAGGTALSALWIAVETPLDWLIASGPSRLSASPPMTSFDQIGRLSRTAMAMNGPAMKSREGNFCYPWSPIGFSERFVGKLGTARRRRRTLTASH